jgi:tyrosyl-tRNA synthetase
MTLSEELKWRGFLENTTYKDISVIDNGGISFYWGVDPSADSMQVGNLAAAVMAKHFIAAGHKAYLLVGGATGLIGDPDGKTSERELKSLEEIEHNKQGIVAQYKTIFAGQDFEIVDNFDWFKDMNYLSFLRDVGKHVPLRQMLGREFVQTRVADDGDGLSYAEFSYSLIQGYDYLRLFQDKNVTLQLAGSDQWGNSIAGVELIRRITANSANVWTSPLIVDKSTGRKFGKSENGTVWLDPAKTTPTAFYQFWVNSPDDSVEDFLKIYTFLSKEQIEQLMAARHEDPKKRLAQKALAKEVTTLVHGEEATKIAEAVSDFLIGARNIAEASDEELSAIRADIHSVKVASGISLVEALTSAGLASSKTEARSLIETKAIYINGQSYDKDTINQDVFVNGRLLIRRGKAFRDSALLEI